MSDFLASIDQFLRSFTAEEQAVTRVVFQSLLGGRPIGLDAVARALGEPAAAIEPVVARLLERGTMERDPSTRQLVGARGLSLTPTPHRLVLDGRPLHAFCAIDAVGIPAALGRDARVESRCHACGARSSTWGAHGAARGPPREPGGGGRGRRLWAALR